MDFEAIKKRHAARKTDFECNDATTQAHIDNGDLIARVEELEAALRPFADWAQYTDSNAPDSAYEFDAELEVGDFRRAYRALNTRAAA